MKFRTGATLALFVALAIANHRTIREGLAWGVHYLRAAAVYGRRRDMYLAHQQVRACVRACVRVCVCVCAVHPRAYARSRTCVCVNSDERHGVGCVMAW